MTQDHMSDVRAWTDHLRSRGRKESTIQGYTYKMGTMLGILRDAGLPTDPGSIGENEVLHLRTHLGVSEDSARGYLKVLGYYCRWATGTDVVRGMDLLWNKGDVDRLFIDDGIMRSLLDVSDERERLILLLGGCMGLRRSEIVGLRDNDISDGRMRILGKGHCDGKVAYMAVPPAVSEAMAEYALLRSGSGLRDESDGHVVVCMHNGAMRPLTPQAISRIVRTVGERAGHRVTPHSLRRLFATDLHDRGVDIMDIKTLMRHDSVDTTINCYINPNKRRLDDIMRDVGFR